MNLLELSPSFGQYWSLLSTLSNTEDCPCGSCSLSLHPCTWGDSPASRAPCVGGGRTALAELIRATAVLHSKARAVKCALCWAWSRAIPGSQQSGMEGVALKICFSFARCQNKNQPAASKLSTLWGGCSTHFRQHEIHNCARVKQSAQDILNQLQTSAKQLSRGLMYKPIGGKCLEILLKKNQAQQSVILLKTCLTPFSD